MSSRQLAFLALQDIYENKAYTDVALDRALRQYPSKTKDRGLISDLVYGIVRRRRTLDSLINQIGNKKASRQHPDLRIILHIGLYQLRYLNQIPESAAVNTSVELAKINNLNKLSGVVNGILRTYIRLAQEKDPLILPANSIAKLGVLYSLPDWIIEIFCSQFKLEDVEKLCAYFNKPATHDLRINPLKTTIDEVKNTLLEAGVEIINIPHLPQGLRLKESVGSISRLPGFAQGWFSIQDASAQLVSHLLNPQPGEMIIDACASPGGKTTHIAELMSDKGLIVACEIHEKRLSKIQENVDRLQLKSVKIQEGDSTILSQFKNQADKVLVDVPCSGLGTLHKRPDIRWRQNPDKIRELTDLQEKLLKNAASWVKPGGKLVYATCTLNYAENEGVITDFLKNHPDWQIESPLDKSFTNFSVTSNGMIKVLPHHHQMDGFFMVKLTKGL